MIKVGAAKRQASHHIVKCVMALTKQIGGAFAYRRQTRLACRGYRHERWKHALLSGGGFCLRRLRWLLDDGTGICPAKTERVYGCDPWSARGRPCHAAATYANAELAKINVGVWILEM